MAYLQQHVAAADDGEDGGELGGPGAGGVRPPAPLPEALAAVWDVQPLMLPGLPRFPQQLLVQLPLVNLRGRAASTQAACVCMRGDTGQERWDGHPSETSNLYPTSPASHLFIDCAAYGVWHRHLHKGTIRG